MKEPLVRLVGGSLKKATSRQVCVDSLRGNGAEDARY
jgi:hypothetical protein